MSVTNTPNLVEFRPNGLGGDSITDRRPDGRTDRQTDGGDYNIPFAFLKKRGDKNELSKRFAKVFKRQNVFMQ